MADVQQVKDALDQIGAATAATNVVLPNIQGLVTSIGEKVDALIAALAAAGVPQEIVDQAIAIAAQADAAKGATEALVPVLQAINAK